MIKSAQEFITLRSSKIKEEYDRASNETADISTWIEVIENHPDFKEWVIHNKTVPVEILELLALDNDPNIRCAVARKRKISDKIFLALSRDRDDNVRYALLCNTALGKEKLKQIQTTDSEWLKIKLNEALARPGA